MSSTGTLPANEVRSMFDRIAPVYDVMNRVMTAGLDVRWRRITAGSVVRPGDRILDACCGTGDLAVAASRAGGKVTGLDFAPRMLERARRKLPTATWVEGDLLALPFEEGSFEVATVGFGVRNVADLQGGLAELCRVLVPNGRGTAVRSREGTCRRTRPSTACRAAGRSGRTRRDRRARGGRAAA